MNSKRKGNSFEIEVSKRLSLWLTDNDRDDIFWRSINSGALQTIRESGMENHAGDIASVHSLGDKFISKCVLECKSYKDVCLWSMISTPNSDGDNIIGWWNKHLGVSRSVNRHPILIVKQNYKPIMFFCSYVFGQSIIDTFSVNPVLIIPTKKCWVFLFTDILSIESKYIDSFLEKLPKWQDM